MRELFKNINKSMIIETTIYRAGIYFMWYCFALASVGFIKGDLTKGKLITLLLVVIIIHIVRTGFKYLYKRVANQNYHDIKHTIELNIFKKTKSIKSCNLEKIDKEKFSNKALEVSYNITRVFSDICEYMIPCIIGVFILFTIINRVSLLLGIITFLLLTALIIFRYNNPAYHEKTNNSNYNDLFQDYILKLDTIRKLNIFDFCYKKLEDNKENDIVILKETGTSIYNDLLFSNLLTCLLFILIVAMLLLINNTYTSLGYILAIIIMMSKMKKLIYMINPTVVNIRETIDNLRDLNEYFKDTEELSNFNEWKKITIKDGVYRYLDTNKAIKIPEFELIKGDACGIIGKSGEGKSTLLNVLTGIYKLESGNIFYDNTVDIRYPDNIYISKEVKTLKLTLRDNLCLGIKKSDEDIISLIKEIGMIDWYNSLTHGLDTYIDERYVALSDEIIGKINIIRCIISQKDLILLDDPSNGMNIESEKLIASMIKKYFKKQAFIIVSHRPIFTTICKKTYFIKDHTLLPKETLL